MTGRTLVHVGPAKVRDKANDDGVAWSAEVQVTDIDEDAHVSGLEIVFAEARRYSGEEPTDVELDGVAVQGTGAEKRRWTRVDGGRLKRPSRQFLEERWGGDPGEDPIEFLLPKRAVSVGDRWDLDMEAIVDLLGRERFTLDSGESFARASLESTVEREGASYARIPFEVRIVPLTITDGGFDDALLALTGAVELPLDGGLPGRVLELEMTTRYKGWIRRKGIRATIDMDHLTVGREERR